MSVKIILVGAGIRGRHWAEIIKGYPEADCVAVVEPEQANLDTVRPLLPEGCPLFADVDAALGSTPADAALIATPDEFHEPLAIRCLAAGLTVMVEKPFAPSTAEAQRINEKARSVGRQVIVAEQYRFFRAERTLKHALEAGLIGQPDHATLVDRRNMPAHSEGAYLAKLDYPQLATTAVHHFDTLRMLFGRPDAILMQGWNPRWSDYAGRTSTSALIRFPSVHVSYLGTMRSHRFNFQLYVEGEHGALWTDRKRVFQRKGGSILWRPVKAVAVPPGDEAAYPRGGTTSLLNALRDAVRENRPAETSGEDNIWSVAMVEAARRSDVERREVAIGPLPELQPALA